jgi:predicted metal-dependent phosphotriesterase family hydrolase
MSTVETVIGSVGERDVRFMKRVADASGVNTVACTGIYTYASLPHYFENRERT